MSLQKIPENDLYTLVTEILLGSVRNRFVLDCGPLYAKAVSPVLWVRLRTEVKNATTWDKPAYYLFLTREKRVSHGN